MFIFLCLCAHSVVLRSVLSPYQNDWDQEMRFNSGFMKDKIITGISSVHHNHHEDRRWRFHYGSAPGVHCFRQRWTSFRNSFDGNLDFKCGSNQALSGIWSKHNNHREDRIWKFQCCILKPYSLHSERLTSYINSWDGVLNFHCGANQVLVGLKSHHSNRREDRLWRARCASLTTQVTVRGIVQRSRLTSYLNKFDKRLKYNGVHSQVITGLTSYHNNHREDRRFRIYRAGLSGVHCKRSWWSNYINSWDGRMSYKCGGNHAMIGLASVHSNKKEDRRFKVRCCDLSNGGKYSRVDSYLSGYANDYDGSMNFKCLSNEFMVGIYSHHNNGREDRRFKFYCGRFVNDMKMSYTGGRSLEVKRRSYFFDKKIDDIFIIMTHNSLALPGKVFSPNQNRGLARQFRDGVRGFNLDLKANGHKMKSCHGKSWWGGGWWCHDPEDDIEGLVKELNRDVYDDSFIFVQLQSEIGTRHYHLLEKWFGSKLVKNFDKRQKLGYYMERGQQVLIFTDKDPRPSQGIHDTHKFIVENQYEWKNRYSTPPMGYRRGPRSGTRIRLMNSFCSGTGLGDMAASKHVNNYGRALRHINEYKKQSYTGGKINVLMVDYYEKGDVFKIQNKMRS